MHTTLKVACALPALARLARHDAEDRNAEETTTDLVRIGRCASSVALSQRSLMWDGAPAGNLGSGSGADDEHAVAHGKSVAIRAGAAISSVAGGVFLAMWVLANTPEAQRAIAAVQHEAAPGLSLDDARRLLIVASTLTIVTVSTWLMLALVRPVGHRKTRVRTRHWRRMPAPSTLQRHRVSIVLGAGVAPIVLASVLPFIGGLLPIGLHDDGNSAVGASLLDWVVGLGAPATLLSVLYFRWVARLSNVATDDADRMHASVASRRAMDCEPTHA